MHGVTTAIVAFILACLIFPKVVKNKPQYYAAVGLVLGVIFFDALAKTIAASGFTWRRSWMSCARSSIE